MAVSLTEHDNQTYEEGELITWHGAEIVFVPVMITVGIVGNLLVFFTYQFRWRSSTVTLIKRMLAVLDLLSLVLVYPALLYMTVRPSMSSFHATCVFTSYAALTIATASGCVLVIIAVDRFRKLCLLQKVGLRAGLSKKLFAGGLLLACVINIPSLWTFGKDQVQIPSYRVSISYCFINSDIKLSNVFYAYISILGFLFLAVCVTLVVLYWKIVRNLHNLSITHDSLKGFPSLNQRPDRMKRGRQSQVMKSSSIVFIAVTVVFFGSHIPYFFAMALSMSNSVMSLMTPGYKAVYDIAKFSPLVNCMANPIIYSFTSKHFRGEVKRMLAFRECIKGFSQRRTCSLACTNQGVSQSSHCEENV